MNRILIAACAMMSAACSSGGTIEVGASATPLTNTQALPVAPASARSQLLVTVREVAVHVAGDDGEARDEGGDGWVTVFGGARALDLLDAEATGQLLGSVDVPAGRVTQVRLVLDGDASLQVDGVARAVRCPSCSESGLKIVAAGNLTVPPGGRLHVDLVFDLDASLTTEDAALVLRPTVRLSSPTTASDQPR